MKSPLKSLKLACVALSFAFFSHTPANANEAYVGEIFLFGGNFCPSNSLPTDGRTIAISEWPALFSILGTQYGGDGRETFALPNLPPLKDANGAGVRYCIAVYGVFPVRR